jgi:hypothetical protein
MPDMAGVQDGLVSTASVVTTGGGATTTGGVVGVVVVVEPVVVPDDGDEDEDAVDVGGGTDSTDADVPVLPGTVLDPPPPHPAKLMVAKQAPASNPNLVTTSLCNFIFVFMCFATTSNSLTNVKSSLDGEAQCLL